MVPTPSSALPTLPLPLALPSFWLGPWARPPDRASLWALAAAVALLGVALVPGGPRWLVSTFDGRPNDVGRSRRFLVVASFAAAFLSLGYIAFYLRGGPRAAESATYWLQGRALSHGNLAWTAPEPTASFRANNLVIAGTDRVAGIFPPGFALLLAPAFMLGAPMLVGPLLAAVLVPVTWLVGRELAAGAGEEEARVEWTGRIAAALSIASVALRYHTAESLPHGATAVALALVLACGLRARRTETHRLFGHAGLALGCLLAIEPASAIGAGVALSALIAGVSQRRRALAWAGAAVLPGAALLLAANHEALGHALASPSALYVSRFVSSRANAGPTAGALGLLREARSHLTDVDNFEPLALLPWLLLVARGRRRVGRPSAIAATFLACQVVVWVAAAALASGRPDSAAIGVTAPALIQLLPIEHGLAALALVIAVRREWASAAAIAALAFALGGFAVHASHDHARFAAADLGRPHYEPDVAREGGATHGLLFFADDEGFELAYDPGALPSHGIEAVHARGDDHDRLVYDALGHPPTHRYAWTDGKPSVPNWTPGGGDVWRFEAEADFPPVGQSDPGIGNVEWLELAGTCASNERALAVTPTGAVDARVIIELPLPPGSRLSPIVSWTVTPRVFQRGSAATAGLALVTTLGGLPVAEWTWSDGTAERTACTDLPSKTLELGSDAKRAWLVLTAHGGSVALDRTMLHAR